MNVAELIEILQEAHPDSSVYLFCSEGGMEDDQRTPLREEHLDLSIEGMVDINIPDISA